VITARESREIVCVAAIFDLLFILTSESIRISRSVLMDTENVGLAVGISSLSCIQAEIFDIAYVLPVMSAIFDFPGHSSIEEYSLYSSNVLLDLKNGVICRKFNDITCESRNLIYIRFDGRHFYLCGRGFEYYETWKIRKNVLVFPLPISENRMKKFPSVPEI